MDYTIAVDIGAGQSTKVAVCASPSEILYEDDLLLSDYGDSFEAYTAALVRTIERVISAAGTHPSRMRGIGVATAGILGADGEFVLIANVPVLQGRNIKTWLEAHYHVPVGIDNDANAGALAEWSVLQVELLYWVFG
ncbi:MAG TPA: ROK family protein, partial [Alkalispirochaeta sp.]|nr:ROK family protein [Alkalispirochaeta sp.]